MVRSDWSPLVCWSRAPETLEGLKLHAGGGESKELISARRPNSIRHAGCQTVADAQIHHEPESTSSKILAVNTSAVRCNRCTNSPIPSPDTEHRQPWALSPGSAVTLLRVERHYAEKSGYPASTTVRVPFDILTEQWHALLGWLMNKRPVYFRAHLT